MRRTNEDEDDASTIDAVTASIKAFFPYLMVPQDAVEKVEGFIKQLAADQVIIIVRARRRPLLYRDAHRLSGRRALGVPAAP